MNWYITLFIVAVFLFIANKVDKKQKEYLDGRIDKLEKRIGEF